MRVLCIALEYNTMTSAGSFINNSVQERGKRKDVYITLRETPTHETRLYLNTGNSVFSSLHFALTLKACPLAMIQIQIALIIRLPRHSKRRKQHSLSIECVSQRFFHFVRVDFHQKLEHFSDGNQI